MDTLTRLVWLAGSGSVLVAIGATAMTIRLARWRGWQDRPNARSVHTEPVPRLGGVAIWLGTVAGAVPLGWWSGWDDGASRIGVLLAGATALLGLGLLDDLLGLRAGIKLAGQLAVAAGVYSLGLRMAAFRLGSGPEIALGWLAGPVTVVWLMGLTNAVNLIDGLDGLASGVTAVAAGVLALAAFWGGDPHLGAVLIALLGGIGGFLLFNYHPARIFMGDGGSHFLGFMVAGGSLVSLERTGSGVAVGLVLLALGVPVLDMGLSVARRLLERRSVFGADRGHIHHRLLDLGMDQREAVGLIAGVTAVVAGLGLFMLVTGPVGTAMIFGLEWVMLVMIVRVAGAMRLRASVARLRTNLALGRSKRECRSRFEIADLIMRQRVRAGQDWWSAVCVAAAGMGLAYVTLRRVSANGRERVEVWRNERYDTGALAELVEIGIPVGHWPGGASWRMAAGVTVDPSLETAAYRAELFTRLMGQYGPAGDEMISRTNSELHLYKPEQHAQA